MADIYGNGHMGPEAIVKDQLAYIKDEHDEAVASSIKGGLGGSIGYLINGEKGAFIGAGIDGVAMSLSGIPARKSTVFPTEVEIGTIKSVPNTSVRFNRFFGKIDPLIKTTAEAIEAAMPNSVLSVERKIVNPLTGKVLTDYDIELNDYIIEVNDGGGEGKLSQIVDNIQSTTKKEVVLFSPRMGGAVEKSMKANNINAFRDVKDLIDYITPKNSRK